MGREDKIRQVVSLLQQTDSAYSSYTRIFPVRDQETHWCEWYAEYLIGHGFDLLVEDRLATELLMNFLRRCRADHVSGGSGLTWEEFTARRMVEQLM